MQPEDTIAMMSFLLKLVIKIDQFSFTWNATENMMIRAGWGESFAAPSLPYIYKGESGSFGTPCDYYGNIITKVL